MFLSPGRTLRLGLRVTDSFRQHLAKLVLGLCGFPVLRRPLGHGEHIGIAAPELKGGAAPLFRHYPESPIRQPSLTLEEEIIQTGRSRDHRKAARPLRRYLGARVRAALLYQATPPPGTRPGPALSASALGPWTPFSVGLLRGLHWWIHASTPAHLGQAGSVVSRGFRRSEVAAGHE